MLPGVLVQLGGRRRFIVARALYELKLLDMLFSDFIVTDRERDLLNSLPIVGGRLYSGFSNRALPNEISAKVSRMPFSFFLWQLISRLPLDFHGREILSLGERVQKSIGGHDLAANGFVYAYDKGAALVLEKAKSSGVRTILDQTIAPNDRMCEVLRSEADALGVSPGVFTDKALTRIMEEQERSWASADAIVCGSSFVEAELKARGLAAPIYPLRPIFTGGARFQRTRKWDGKRPLRVLFVGQLSFRKGIHLLVNVARRLGKLAEFRFVGNFGEDSEVLLRNIPANIKVRGFRRGNELMNEYDWADVFSFPSLWEGSAYVVTEASSLGLPCVVTFSSGSWIKDGLQGFVLNSPTADNLFESLTKLIESPELIEMMSTNAIQFSRDYAWDNYKKSLNAVICDNEENSR